MGIACWPVGVNGGYWMDLRIGNQTSRAMVDVGLVDPRGMIGLEVQPVLFDALERSGQLNLFHRRQFRASTGQMTVSRCALAEVQMMDPGSRLSIGPPTTNYISRGATGVQNRVGVVFFHRLIGCRVVWDLDRRVWAVEYP